MAKKLRIQDRLLLGLALVGEITADTVGAASQARRSGTLNFWSPPGYKSKNYYETIWRMLRTGNIERIIRNNKPYFRLTSEGKEKIIRDFPLLKWQNKRWDGRWRIVIFDIEEKNRKSRAVLRRKLLDLGFGKLQRSIYISPYDIGEDMKEFLESRNYFSDEVLVLEARQKLIGDPKEIADQVWKLTKLEERYLNLEIEIDKMLDKPTSEEKIKKIHEAYLGVVTDDPLLPKELLPVDWPAERICRKLSKLRAA